eukprot:g3803.t1
MADGGSEDDMSSDLGEYQERDDGQARFEEELKDSKGWAPEFAGDDSRVPHVVRYFSAPLFFLSVVFALRKSGLCNHFTLAKFLEDFAFLEYEFSNRPLLAVLSYLCVHGLVVTFSLQGATMLSLMNGAIFPRFLSVFLSVCGATIGAVGCYKLSGMLLVPTIRDVFHLDKPIPEILKEEASIVENVLKGKYDKAAPGKLIRKSDTLVNRQKKDPMKQFREAFGYDSFLSCAMTVCLLRVLPFPFFVVTVVCALLELPYNIFVIGTALGTVPFAFLYTSIGVVLGNMIREGAKQKFEVEKGRPVSETDDWTFYLESAPKFKITFRKLFWECPKNPVVWKGLIVWCSSLIAAFAMKIFLHRKAKTEKEKIVEVERNSPEFEIGSGNEGDVDDQSISINNFEKENEELIEIEEKQKGDKIVTRSTPKKKTPSSRKSKRNRRSKTPARSRNRKRRK